MWTYKTITYKTYKNFSISFPILHFFLINLCLFCRLTWWQHLNRVWATWPSGWRVSRWQQSRRWEQLLFCSLSLFLHTQQLYLIRHCLRVQDSELNELRKTIELLKKQNAVAQAAINGVINTPELVPKGDRTGADTLQTQSHCKYCRGTGDIWGAAKS